MSDEHQRNRWALAEAMGDWMHDHSYTAEDMGDIDASGRAAVARLTRLASPHLFRGERPDYVPAPATWAAAIRFMVITERAGVRAHNPDPFAGFPRH